MAARNRKKKQGCDEGEILKIDLPVTMTIYLVRIRWILFQKEHLEPLSC